MSNVVIAHAIQVGPDSGWYPGLDRALTAAGHRVQRVAFPDPQAPARSAWIETLERATEALEAPDTVLVGHSLGGVALLRLLERHDVARDGRFAGVVLVATMAQSVGFDALAEFIDPPFAWPAIRQAAGAFRQLAALDDPVLAPGALVHVETLLGELGGLALVEEKGGHYPSWDEEDAPAPDDLPQATALVLDCLAGGD